MADSRPGAYYEGDTIVFRASSLGNCTKSLAHLLQGVTPAEPPAHMLRIFEQGNVGEADIIQRVQNYGWDVFTDRGQELVELEILPNVIIRGHMDGIVGRDNIDGVYEKRVLECKTTSRRGISSDLQDKYDMQISVYMHYTGLKGLFAIGTKGEDGKVVDCITHEVDEPPFPLVALKRRCAEIIAMSKKVIEPCSGPDYPCPVFFLHEDLKPVDAYGLPENYVPIVESDDLDRFAGMYLDAQQAEAAAKDEKANARKMIVDWIGGEGEERKTGRYQISWSGGGTTKSLDQKKVAEALKTAGLDIEDFYVVKPRAKSISVKEIAE